MFTLNGGTVSWKSSKQEMTVDSITGSKYIIASKATKKAIWIRKFIVEQRVVHIVDLIPLYCDNNGDIEQAKEPSSHQRSKHALKRYHLIREIIGRHDVTIEKVPTD